MSTNNENPDNNSNEDQSILGRVQEDQNARDGGGGGATAAAVVEATMNNESIGYCHVCDKQVPINSNSFTCSECNGGFIELFENDNRPLSSLPTQQQQQQQQQQEGNDPQRVRLESMRLLNDSNMANLLPMLLPQLFGQNMNPNIRMSFMNPQMNQNQNSTNSAVGTPTDPSAATNEQSYATFSSGTQSNSSSNNQPNISAHRMGPTRLQFIVPGEQFDLYGVINNVLSDFLDPLRMQGGGIHVQSMTPNAQFHFQPPIRTYQLHGDVRDYAWGITGLDTVITQLLNQLENTGPPPATEQQVQNLPSVKINQEEFDNNVQCAICMEDFKLGEEAKKLPCKHYFHEPCILEWLKLHGTCPVCRKNLNGEDTSQREYISRPPPPATAGAQQSETLSSSLNESTQAANPSNNDQQQQSVQETPNTSNTMTPSTSTSGHQPNPSVYQDMDFD